MTIQRLIQAHEGGEEQPTPGPAIPPGSGGTEREQCELGDPGEGGTLPQLHLEVVGKEWSLSLSEEEDDDEMEEESD